MKKKVCSIAIVLCLLLGLSLSLTSCDQATDAVGIAKAIINENGELILSYTDGSEQSLGVIVGKDGKDGADGADGKDGVDGANGTDGADGKDGKDGADATGGGNTIVVNGGSVAAASAKGLRSAVSILCKFRATVQQGGWRPGSSSTTTKEYSSEGSGVIYKINKSTGDAFIITNYHVVYDASSNTANGISDDISIYLYGSETDEMAIKADYVGGSLYYDIAVLHVSESELIKSSAACAVDVADSDEISVGDTAIAIGNAQGYGISTCSGIVSVDSEYITMTAADGKTAVSFRVIRVDTAVNSGNSGGGLYDECGSLIGIVNAKVVDDGVENIGYAIPSNVAVSIAENIIHYCYDSENESVMRAIIGITVHSADSRAIFDSESGDIRIVETVSVYDVTIGSLAHGVLEVGDVLLSVVINDSTREITRQYHAVDFALDLRVGDVITINVLRGGEQISLTLTVTEHCLTAY